PCAWEWYWPCNRQTKPIKYTPIPSEMWRLPKLSIIPVWSQMPTLYGSCTTARNLETLSTERRPIHSPDFHRTWGIICGTKVYWNGTTKNVRNWVNGWKRPERPRLTEAAVSWPITVCLGSIENYCPHGKPKRT